MALCVATHALGQMVYSWAQVVYELPQSHCGDNQERTYRILKNAKEMLYLNAREIKPYYQVPLFIIY